MLLVISADWQVVGVLFCFFPFGCSAFENNLVFDDRNYNNYLFFHQSTELPLPLATPQL